MTKEEACNVLNRLKPNDVSEVNDSAYCIGEALTMAVETLSAKPCDDAIDRKYLTGLMFTEADLSDAHTCYESIRKIVEEMPSVKPIRPKGHWKETYKNELDYFCNSCNYCTNLITDFCPNCGADMREVEE